MEPDGYAVPQWEWTDADFDHMSWHDATVHGIALIPERYELAFDIDYILEWVDPTPATSGYYSFWVAPATLVFENVGGIELWVRAQLGEFEIFQIHRSDEILSPYTGTVYRNWQIEGGPFPPFEANATFHATGYKQYLRQQPIYGKPSLSWDERGGISFARERL